MRGGGRWIAVLALAAAVLGVAEARVAKTVGVCEIEEAEGGSLRDYRIVTLVDTKMVEVYLNWLIYFHSTCPASLSRLVVVCMDNGAKALLKNLPAAVSCSPQLSFDLGPEKGKMTAGKKASKESRIWQRRVAIVTGLLQEGMDVILSDADALWLDGPGIMRDISEQLQMQMPPPPPPGEDRVNGTDKGAAGGAGGGAGGGAWLVASRAWWPWDVYERWGATACMGFAYVKAAPSAVEFFQQLHAALGGPAPAGETRTGSGSASGAGSGSGSGSGSGAGAGAGSGTGSGSGSGTGSGTGSGDDQAEANALLARLNVTWGRARLGVGGDSTTDRGTLAAGRGSVVLLPHHRYPRQCHAETPSNVDSNSNSSSSNSSSSSSVAGAAGLVPVKSRSMGMTVVDAKARAQAREILRAAVLAHCRLPKGEPYAKKARLKAYGLWKLGQQWRHELAVGGGTRAARAVGLPVAQVMQLLEFGGVGNGGAKGGMPGAEKR